MSIINQELLDRIEAFIKENLENSIPGQVFTTEVEIANMFGISRPTARKYLDVFYNNGLIERVAGKGIAAASADTIAKNRKTRNYLLMVSFSGIDDGYFSEIVKGISDVLNERGDRYRIFMNVNYDDRLEFLKTLDLSEYDGAFISLYEDKASYAIADLLKENGVEIILIDNQLDFYTLNCVKNDDVNSGFLLGRYLKENGLNPLFLLPGKRKNSTNFERNGFQIDKSLRDRICGVQCGLGRYCEPLPDECFIDLKNKEQILSLAKKGTAFVFYDATSVYGVWNFLKDNNEQAIEDVRFCAFGNSLLNNDFANGVYIKFNGYEVGKAAAKLSDRIKKGIYITENIRTSLVAKAEKK